MNYNFKEWKFRELHAWMDGGSITLNYTDQNGQNNTIEVVQHVSEEYHEEISKIPGRIYVNKDLVDKRSIEEDKIVEQLTKDLANQQTEHEKRIVEQKIEWIKSSRYLEFKPQTLELSKERIQYLKTDKTINRTTDK